MNPPCPSSAKAAGPIAFIAFPTPLLEAVIAEQQAILSPEDFPSFIASIRGVFDKYTTRLLEFPPGRTRANALHYLIDRELKVAAQLPITCGKGCSGCCHYEVEINQDEAEVLKDLVLAGFPLDHDRLQHQAARERKSKDWMKFWSPENRCVFLGRDGACQIYEHRPAICRKHLVTNPPAACTTAGGAVMPVRMILVEILLSSALSLPGNTSGSLSKMLSNALQTP